MQDILRSLNKVPGVKGSMVVTEDGMIVTACLGPDLNDETVAAISAHMIATCLKGTEPLGLDKLNRFSLTSTHGRMLFVNLDIAYLVVVTRQNIKLDVILLEIDSTAYRIKNRRVK